MDACNGVRGLKNAEEAMSDEAKRWKSIVSSVGGAMNKVYKEANGRVTTPVSNGTTPDDGVPYVQGRNAATINRVTRILKNWVVDNDVFPHPRTLAHFTEFEMALWSVAIDNLLEEGYVVSPGTDEYTITERPSSPPKEDLSEYIRALPKQERIELIAELLGS